MDPKYKYAHTHAHKKKKKQNVATIHFAKICKQIRNPS